MFDDVDDGKDPICALCGKDGELVVCDECPKAFHLDCLPTEIDLDAPFDCALGEQHCEKNRNNITWEARTQNAKFSEPISKGALKKSNIRCYNCVDVDGQMYQVNDYAYFRRDIDYQHKNVPWVGQINKLWRGSTKNPAEQWCSVQFVFMPEDTSLGRLPKHGEKEVFIVFKELEVYVGEILGKCLVVHQSHYEAAKKDPVWKDRVQDIYYYSKLYNELLESFRPAPLPSEKDSALVPSPSAPLSKTTTPPPALFSSTKRKYSAIRDKVEEEKEMRDVPLIDFEDEEDIQQPTSAVEKAASKLQLSSVPDRLPCREKEYEVIVSYLRSAIRRHGKTSGMYVSGMPGTGKTATVRQAVRELKTEVAQGKLPEFEFLEINALKLATAQQAYTLLYEAIEGVPDVAPHKALALLGKRFARADPKRKCCVVLLDEIDYIQCRNHSVLYNFFEWPGRQHAKFCVVGIANTMNLPETLPARVQSRLGLTRLNFASYTRSQLETIVRNRLADVNCFDDRAIELCARKVSSVSGDVRRALQVGRRAIQLFQMDCEIKKAAGEIVPETFFVDLKYIKRASRELAGEPVRQLLALTSLFEKCFLIALATLGTDQPSHHSKKTLEEVIVKCQSFLPKIKVTKLTGPSFLEWQEIATRLAASGILVVGKDKFHGDWDIILGVQPEDISYAFGDDEEVGSFLKT